MERPGRSCIYIETKFENAGFLLLPCFLFARLIGPQIVVCDVWA
jgi:hypothetical protein